ncbi:MAG: acetate kinase [Gemmataceae bacterium]|nr:acetate kinase [Gemmataceae bacterium]
MSEPRASLVLTLNAGSSSLKFALYRLGAAEDLLARGNLERIGLDGGTFRAQGGNGEQLAARETSLPDHAAALAVLLDWLSGSLQGQGLTAVGHRVVQGGPHFTQPHAITPEVLATLRQLVPLAPNHLPGELLAIEASARAFPGVPQVACFDTAFHTTLPPHARRFALPRELYDEGVRRYGFHGLSYQYVVEELRRVAGPADAEGRVVIAHLGNGASMAAVRGGRSVDTTMGLTPLGGLVMGTRCGDLDPGVILYLLREKALGVTEADELLHARSGLLGVSGTSPNMHDLIERQASDPRAAEAIDLFCYQARKFIAALAAGLEGLDTLVFTAGIGEHAPYIRARICQGLEFLGVVLDPARNDANSAIISRDRQPVTVRVVKTNEELMIARQTIAAVRQDPASGQRPA